MSLQRFGDPEDALIRLQHQEVTPEDIANATTALKAKQTPPLPADEIERRAPAEASSLAQQRAIAKVEEILGDAYIIRSTEFVGPKVGQEYIENAVLASVLALLGIMAYVWFRYEWQFAVNCIVALFHDCITTVGLFSLLGIQFDLTTVAAVLTIAGFSVNDTVVIYDRIREELRRYKKMPLGELLSMSINRTLSRTTMTSGLAFLAVLALYLFGGEVLRGFSIAMMWGIVVGTYSTIFVAAPMLVYMNLRRDRVAGGKPADAGAGAQRSLSAARGSDAAHPRRPADRRVLRRRAVPGHRRRRMKAPSSCFPRARCLGRWRRWTSSMNQSLEPVVAEAQVGGIDLLLLGCGARMAMVPAAVRQYLRAAGVVVEGMDTGAACRTYNVLMADGRRVAAALIAFNS